MALKIIISNIFKTIFIEKKIMSGWDSDKPPLDVQKMKSDQYLKEKKQKEIKDKQQQKALDLFKEIFGLYMIEKENKLKKEKSIENEIKYEKQGKKKYHIFLKKAFKWFEKHHNFVNSEYSIQLSNEVIGLEVNETNLNKKHYQELKTKPNKPETVETEGYKEELKWREWFQKMGSPKPRIFVYLSDNRKKIIWRELDGLFFFHQELNVGKYMNDVAGKEIIRDVIDIDKIIQVPKNYYVALEVKSYTPINDEGKPPEEVKGGEIKEKNDRTLTWNEAFQKFYESCKAAKLFYGEDIALRKLFFFNSQRPEKTDEMVFYQKKWEIDQVVFYHKDILNALPIILFEQMQKSIEIAKSFMDAETIKMFEQKLKKEKQK